MNQEEHFDDRIRRKLQDAGEESALTWEQVNQGLNDTGRNWMRGFLFSDLLLALLFAGYLLSNNPEVNAAGSHTQLKLDGSSNTININSKAVQQSKVARANSNEEVSSLLQSKSIANQTTKINSEHNNLTESTSSLQIQHQLINDVRGQQQNLNKKTELSRTNAQHKKSAMSELASVASSPKIIIEPLSNVSIAPNNRSLSDIRLCEIKLISIDEVELEKNPKSRIISDSLPDLFPTTSPGVLPLAIDLYGILPVDLTSFSTNTNNADIKLNPGSLNRNFGYGLALRYPLSEHLVVTGGWQMVKSSYDLNYNFYYDHFFWHVDSITGFILSPFDPPVPLTIYDSTEVNETIRADIPVNINETKMQCPVTIGYRIVRNNWTFEGNAGLIYTFTQKQLISYSELSTEEKSYLEPLFPVFKTSNQLDATVSMGVARNLSGIFEIFLHTFYQQALGASTTAESVPEIHHRYAGLKAGVRINFNKK